MDTPPPLPSRFLPSKRKKIRLPVFIVAAALIAFAVWKLYLSANNHLAARDIPRLPSAASVEHLREGGFFSGWLYIRASLAPEDFEAYAAKFTQARETIGTAKGQVWVVRHEDADSYFNRSPFPQAEPLFVSALAGTESWWTPHAITRGFVYRWTDGVDGWRVFFDEERRLVFIHWHHS